MKCGMMFVLAACLLLAADKPNDEAVKQEWRARRLRSGLVE